MGRVEFRILGPFEVVAGGSAEGTAVPLGGPKQRAVLASLVLRANETVSIDALVDALWDGDVPSSARGVVHTYVSRLRRSLSAASDEGTRLVRRPAGYALDIDPGQVDAHRFERLVHQGRQAAAAGRPGVASETLARALSLWQGPVLADLADQECFQPVMARFEQMRLVAVEERIDADLALGRHTQVVGELQGLTAHHPFRERFWAQLIVALYRSGRQADALDAYQKVRGILVEQLGIVPGPDLRALELGVLRQAEHLDWRRPPLPPALAEGVQSHPLVGRAGEHTRLVRSLDAARAGTFNAVFLGGPPGIGKSALAAAFARRAHDDGAAVVFGRADETTSQPFQVFREAIDSWPPTGDVAGLGLLTDEDAALLARLAPRLGATPRRPSPAEAEGGDIDRRLLFEAIARWVGALAADRPAVVVLEDLHWADRASLLALRHLLRHPPRHGALVVATFRSCEVEPGHELTTILTGTRSDPHVSHVELPGLTHRDVVDLLRTATSGGRDRDSDRIDATGVAFAAQLNRRTGGNPLFIHETLRHLTEQGAISPGQGEWASEQALDASGVPAGVAGVVDQRLRRLPDATTSVLRQAAVLGEHFDVPALSRVTGLTHLGTVEALDPAVAMGIVRRVDALYGRFAFSHALVRDAVLDGVPLADRVRAHWRAGVAIASVRATHLEPYLGEIALHLTAGVHAGEPSRAIRANVDAGMQALEVLAFEDACGWFRTATDLLDGAGAVDPPLAYAAWFGLALAANAAGSGADSQYEGYLRAAAIARAQGWPGHLARAAIGLTLHSVVAHDPGREDDRGLDLAVPRLLDEALTGLGDTATAERSLLLAIKTMRAVTLGRRHEARALADQAAAVARSVDGPTAESGALLARCYMLVAGPDPEELDRVVDQVLTLAVPVEARMLVHALVLPVLPVAALQMGDRAAFDAARARVAAHPAIRQSVHPARILHMWEAAVALANGRYHEVERLGARIAGAHDATGWWIWGGATAVQAAVAAVDRGDLSALLPGVVQLLSSHPESVVFRATLASLDAHAGNLADAAHHVDALGSRWRTDEPGWDASLTLNCLADVAVRLGRRDLAADLVDVLGPYTGQLLIAYNGTAVIGAADRVIGQLLLTLGEVDEASERLAAAHTLESSFGADALVARTRYWQARARLAHGDGPAARELLSQASSEARRLGMDRLLGECTGLATKTDGLAGGSAAPGPSSRDGGRAPA